MSEKTMISQQMWLFIIELITTHCYVKAKNTKLTIIKKHINAHNTEIDISIIYYNNATNVQKVSN